MKAITLDRATAFALINGQVDGVMAKRSVPREMIGRKVIIHAKGFDTGNFRSRMPAVGIGYATFGEALPQLNGDCFWPVTSVEPWAKLIRAPGRAGFWTWSYEHG